MKKLIIQIPCFNEESTLSVAVKDLPKKIEGIDSIEVLIIDDGSTDRTVEVARELGVDHIISFPQNRGLAKGFLAGLDAACKLGADIIVNTDADNQYCAQDIEALVQPILKRESEIVVGERPISEIEHFSPIKKFLQKLGSKTVQVASGARVPDAPSGFRAMSRDAALRLNVYNDYTYTLETIIQAGQNGITISSVPVRTNADLRPSRLVKSISRYVRISMGTILRVMTIYRPFRTFFSIGSLLFLGGFAIGVRWLILFFIIGTERTHVPSLILASILMLLGATTIMMAIIGDLLAVNRKLMEDIQYRIRKMESGQKPE